MVLRSDGNKNAKLADGTQQQSVATGQQQWEREWHLGPQRYAVIAGQPRLEVQGIGSHSLGKRMININQGPGPQSRRPGPASLIPTILARKQICHVMSLLA